MSEPKSTCGHCGATILVRTAKSHQGNCVPCARKLAAIPPVGFQLPVDLIERIETLGESFDVYRAMAWRNGTEFVYGFLDRQQERADLFATWFPRLREFAEEARRTRPAAAYESPAPRERAMADLIAMKIKQAESPPHRDRESAMICTVPRWALSAAAQQWPGVHPMAVLLTHDELSEWDEVYRHPEGAFWWFAYFDWGINDENASAMESLAMFAQSTSPPAVPEGNELWRVATSSTYGPLSGHGKWEYWIWDGQQSSFLKDGGVWDS